MQYKQDSTARCSFSYPMPSGIREDGEDVWTSLSIQRELGTPGQPPAQGGRVHCPPIRARIVIVISGLPCALLQTVVSVLAKGA
jgi:hypothetical protein